MRLLPFSLIAVTVALVVSADARWKPQYADATEELQKLRKWFYDMKVPGTDHRCCSQADGAKAARRWAKDGSIEVRYFADFEAYEQHDMVDSGWVRVPPEAIIHGQPNQNGAATVWWFQEGEPPYTAQSLRIRCFIDDPEG
jgi:hypothetical protein